MATKTELNNINGIRLIKENSINENDVEHSSKIGAGFIFRGLNMVSSKLTTKMLFNMFFSPNRLDIEDRHISYYSKAFAFKIIFEEKQIAIYEFGKKENNKSILVVNDWSSIPYHMRSIIDALVYNGYHVISFDLPGHGFSEGNQTNLFEVSRLIEKISQRFRFDTILGYSFGGLASLIHCNNSNYAKNLILISSPMSINYSIEEFSNKMNLSDSMKNNLISKIEKELDFKVKDYDMTDKLYNSSKFLLIHDKNENWVKLTLNNNFVNKNENSELYFIENQVRSNILKSNKVKRKILSFLN
ncbi:MAG: 2-succinyl-6-hydroxy-2,4-cyclohexadiene-1-carboxylate synthase [Candidatus Heimdallarchaeota archaeon LC_3]|nr:MAG: 2-succinyl-6-hydroxy-2,4-cyclohexadiene-1-carboxylate synthase [Candidatus Heimdallarchaeota archaeon LC_3]